MSRKSAGRMINQSISLSAQVASLSPESMALFCLLIPHFDAHGKQLGNPYTIKGSVCPLVDWFSVEKIEECLREISIKTSVKWWKDGKGLHYLHSLNWDDHQNLRKDRLGPDSLPDYPGENPLSPDQLPDNSGSTPAEGKLREVEGKGRKKVKSEPSPDALRLSGLLADLISENNPGNRSIQPEQKEKSISSWATDIDRMARIDKRPLEEAEEVIRWSQSNSFWQSNILSGKALRGQYDKLLIQMRNEPKTPSRKPESQDTYRSYQCI